MKTTTISILILAIAGALGTATASPAPAPGSQPAASSPAHVVPAAPRVGELRAAMRKLWEDHIVYTRNYIISALADLPDTDEIAKRLLANQDEIGAAIKPYYGDAAGNKLAALLRDHITIATEVVAAAKAGVQAQLAKAQAKWSGNGKDIAAFLSGANPNWSRQGLEAMLQKPLT